MNLSIRPSNGKSIVSIPSMMSILVPVHENERKRPRSFLNIFKRTEICKSYFPRDGILWNYRSNASMNPGDIFFTTKNTNGHEKNLGVTDGLLIVSL